MSVILEKMRLGTEYRFGVTLRGYTVSMRPLTIVETVLVTDEIAQEVNKRPQMKSAVNEKVLFALKTLRIASTSKPGANDPQLTEAELQNATPDELLYLFSEYLAGVERVNPSIEAISVEELESIIAEAKKNTMVLTQLSFRQVVSVCLHLMRNSLPDK